MSTVADIRMQAENLLRSQLEDWPMARANYEAMADVRVKATEIDGLTVKVQFNPARIVSSGAKVDAASIKARPCFLCEANRPQQQRGLPWGDYTILINPFPIFPRHFTIPINRHEDQRISDRMAHMMRLAMELRGYTVFYNGPRCGASAPDHMHFQAGNSDFLTLPHAITQSRLTTVSDDGTARLSIAERLPMGVLVIDAADPDAGERMFNRLYAALPEQFEGEEPMMNLLCHGTDAGVRLIVIPRAKHRPSCYGTDTPGSMLLSPASVDVGGVFITPRESDFEALDADTIRSVLQEVCIPDVSGIIDRFNNTLS